MLRIEEDFDAASKATREYLASRKDGSASVSSSAEMLTVNVRYGMNISEKSSETYIKDHVSTEPLQESREVGISQDISQNNDPVSVPIENRQYSSLSNATCNLSMKEVPVKDQMSVTSVGGLEKRCKLCFRCLALGHSGKTCPRSRQCGLNGCKELHHRLLHRPSETKPKSTDQNRTDNQASGRQIISGSEGNKNLDRTTMTASNVSTADFIALRTVPVILTNGDRSLKVNALLDDASTKTYVNSDVAAQLGLQGKTG